ncbi:MAG: YaaA family protein [Candidatus Nanopelagicales bacterium]
MLILLPPSEGKAAPSKGRPLRMSTLAFSTLSPTREAIAAALMRLCDGPAATARTVLGISTRQDDELQRNRDLLTTPAAPAGEIYTGVLYDALDLASLPARARTRAAADIAIASALFGLLKVTDPIPAYRLSADTTLPRVGPLAATWRPVLGPTIVEAAGTGIVLDLRSSAYVALGPVPVELGERTAVARVLQERGGTRSVVSHHNKATKGRLVRSLLAEPRAKSIDDLAGALGAAGYRVELAPPRKDGQPWTIDVIVRET